MMGSAAGAGRAPAGAAMRSSSPSSPGPVLGIQMVCDFVVEAGQAWWECLWRPFRLGRGHPGLVALPWPVADQLGFSCVRRSRPPVPYRCDL